MQVLKKDLQRVLKVAFKKRKHNSNKSNFGKVLIIGGGKKYLGAGVLSAMAATKSGAGYTYLMSDLNYFNALKFPDFIVSPFSIKFLADKQNFSIGIGPGLGLEKNKVSLLKFLIKAHFPKVVVDADALAILSMIKFKNTLPKDWILTPHEGELARLLNFKNKVTEKKRLELACLLQKKYGCHVLLKGSENIFIDSNGKYYFAKYGSPVLSKAGSGDILTGLIVNQMNYQKNSLDAMIAASYIQGRSAKKYLAAGYNERSMRPVDLLDYIAKIN